MHTHHVLCSECKSYRKYEGETLGKCLQKLANDGWVMATDTKLKCAGCSKGNSTHLKNV